MKPPLITPPSLVTRINVTPIIDVALVLVIILLVTAPMLTVSDLEVDLPAARTRDAEEAGSISVTVSRRGEIDVDLRPVADVAALAAELRAQIAARDQAEVYVVVRADAGLPHAFVREVLDAARVGGATRLGIATRQRTGGGS